ncbi:hypothetical protein CLIB1444_04S01926 [[Candida] jaroonii]|uniref:Uncharacterized protein n=1 Tax=[Candida] jaroonii TaxID=467808 RepID=A0ACA9Y6L7_9ASCO|nr:hypothetical protein CLIB1444_04S01926 [[Candida] jaroonii]
MNNYFTNTHGGPPPQSNPLSFPSYNSSQITPRIHEKPTNPTPLSNLKHRLPLPQESQHHQHGSLQHPNHHKALPTQLHTSSANNSGNGSVMSSLPPPSTSETTTKPDSDGIDTDKPKRERKNRPGQRFGAKKKSWVWSWFIQDTTNPNIAACDYCGKVITRLPSDKGSPKKLSEHLKTHKLDKESINHTRQIPIDGNGVTYHGNGNGTSINFDNYQNKPQPQSPPLGPMTIAGVSMGNTGIALDRPELRTSISSIDSINTKSKPEINYVNQRRYLSADFDNSPYTPMKFQKHLLEFLSENKLSINAIKSHSFQQLVYDLRSDSMVDLSEITGLFSTLLEASRSENQNNSLPIEEVNLAQNLAQTVERKETTS